MGKPHFIHSESLLHTIWQNRIFDTSGVKTECGKPINILKTGLLNHTDGPDFENASLVIDGLAWYGSVELHLASKDWYSHGHHNDENYNSVVLHVVLDDSPVQVTCKNGNLPFTLNLSRYIEKGLQNHAIAAEKHPGLPCPVSYISQDAFLEQIEKAHQEYFAKKTDDFLAFYDPELLPSTAWKHALIISVFDGFGIPHNRHAMQMVAKALLDSPCKGKEIMLADAFRIAGFDNVPSAIVWNHKAIRPANHPGKRIRECVQLAYSILQTPFEIFLEKDSIHLWEKWIKNSGLANSRQQKILYGTVFLPSMYMLGTLFASQTLTEQAFSTWKNLKSPVTAEIEKAVNTHRYSFPVPSKKLGAVYQLKHYCEAQRCTECLVLEKVFQS